MRAVQAAGVLVAMVLAAGCGGTDEPEPKEEPMKVEDTVFGDLVGTQDKARDRANAAVEVHRDSLEKRIDADEDAPPEE